MEQLKTFGYRVKYADVKIRSNVAAGSSSNYNNNDNAENNPPSSSDKIVYVYS